MQLSYNDMKLIKYLYECEFLTREQINNYIFKDMNNSYIRKRLPMLKRNKFIKYKRNPFDFVNEKYVYMVDFFAEENLMMEKTHNKFKKMCNEFDLHYINTDNYKLKDKLDLRRVFKQYNLNNVRFMFENIGVKHWIPYYIFKNLNMGNKIKDNDKRTFEVYPDGIIQENNTIAIELERKIKPKIHYRDLFIDYHKEDLFKIIIFVAYGKQAGNIYNGLQSKLNDKFASNYKDLPDHFYNKFFVIEYNDLMKGNYDIYNKKMDKTINIKNII